MVRPMMLAQVALIIFLLPFPVAAMGLVTSHEEPTKATKTDIANVISAVLDTVFETVLNTDMNTVFNNNTILNNVFSTDMETPPQTVRLMSEDRETELRRLLPQVDDERLQRVLGDPHLILYTEEEMPKSYQFWAQQLRGIHSARYNISAVKSEPHGNGNIEFPWGTPAGTHRTPNVTSLRFLWLPRDDAGRLQPVVWFRKHLQGDDAMGYAWTFPVGTIFGEVLALRNSKGHDYTFELRMRIRQTGDWDVEVFRPFPRAHDLARQIKQLRPDWQQDPKVANLVSHLEEPSSMETFTLSDVQPDNEVFSQSMGIDTLPAVDDDELVIQLLTQTTFKPVSGEMWRTDDEGDTTCAPTTEAAFHIVPANYDGGFIEVDRVSCMRCHETVNQSVRRFNAGRDWYGRIRGSDGIFSFHPFEPSTVSSNGLGGQTSMRRELVDGGVLEPFDEEKHPNSIYNQVPFLEE